jgi:hypothetical protein
MLGTQDVNLYRPALSHRHKAAPKAMLVSATVGVALVVLLWVGKEAVTWWSLNKDLQAAIAAQTSAETTLQQREQAARVVDTTLPQLDVQDIKLKAAAAQNERQHLAQLLALRHAAISALMTAIARQKVDGLWITQLAVGGTQHDVLLTGRSIDPGLVPRYLAGLYNEAAFANVQWRSFKLNQPDEGKGGDEVEFVVGTRASNEATP